MTLPKERALQGLDRQTLLTTVVAAYEELMRVIAGRRGPGHELAGVSMAQAKALQALGAADELHMSALVSRLGVSLSSVSELVERLVDRGLVQRRDDPADRRQVVVAITPAGRELIDHLRELGIRELRMLLEAMDDHDLGVMAEAIQILVRTTERVPPALFEHEKSDRKDLP